MADQPVGEIIKAITDDVKVLVRDEIELAKSELIPAAKNAGIGGGLLGAAGYFAICALSILYFCVAFALVAAGLQTWLAFLIVGVALLLVAAVLGGIGFMLVRRVKAPKRSIAQATATVNELKSATQQALAAIKGDDRKSIEP